MQGNNIQANKRQVGDEKETIACDFLIKNNYDVLEKNFRTRQGEIDIVAFHKEQKVLVFVEVKYRKDIRKGHPFEAINLNKIKKICKMSLFYINLKKINVEKTKIRYDVIGILGKKITHLENAFSYLE